jgi:hypothetical protein
VALLQPYPPGARRVERPAAAKPCTNCGELIGRGYPDCVLCAEQVDDLWWADWRALLDAEHVAPGTDAERGVAELVLSQEVGAYSWTCMDWALWLLRCTECGGQQGSGDLGCVICAASDAARWAWDYAAIPHAMTANEHALRVAVAGLRAPHRHRLPALKGWRLALPFLLTGETPTVAQAQRIRTLILAGRYEELAMQSGFCAMTSLPDLPWRS